MIKKIKRKFGIHEPSTTHSSQEVDPEGQGDMDGSQSENNKNLTYTVEKETWKMGTMRMKWN